MASNFRCQKSNSVRQKGGHEAEMSGHAWYVRVRSHDSVHIRVRVRVRKPKKSCVSVRVCFGHGLGHELMSELVSVSVHLWFKTILLTNL